MISTIDTIETPEVLEQQANDSANMEMAAMKLLESMGYNPNLPDQQGMDQREQFVQHLQQVVSKPERIHSGIMLVRMFNDEVKGHNIIGGTIGNIGEVKVLEMLMAARIQSQLVAIKQKLLQMGGAEH